MSKLFLERIYAKIYKVLTWHIWNKRLKYFGKGSQIIHPLKIEGHSISIGTNVVIQYKAWLASIPLTGEKESRLEIRDGCIIGNYNEIYSTKSIIVESDVLTADRVYISDNLHEYEDIKKPISKQPVRQISTVRIGEGSWLGVGVSVIGANIGKHCVIGANTVVTHDIPDFCVAVGTPAKIIKRYNTISKKWERTHPDGSFINAEVSENNLHT